jgi:hypothetical protein
LAVDATAGEACPPSAAGQVGVFDRGNALVAWPLGGRCLGGCRHIRCGKLVHGSDRHDITPGPHVVDSVGLGFVESLVRHGGNITGFSAYDAPMMGKWVQLLKEVAPRVTRLAVIFNPDTAPEAPPSLKWDRKPLPCSSE